MGAFTSQHGPSFPLPHRQRSKTRWIVLAGLVVVAAAMLLWSCGKGMYHNYRLSTGAVERLHRQLDQADYETIYGEATEEFRRAGSRTDEIKFLETVHQKMGNSGKISSQGFHVNWQNGRVTANQVVNTQFALGQAQEAFVWIIEQDQPRLQSYRINSPNLR
jgi:hypothetical protein